MMRARRILPTVAALALAAVFWCWSQSCSAGDGSSPPSVERSKAKPANSTSLDAKKAICGRAFDTIGKPVAGAMVLLTRNEGWEIDLPVPRVIAESRSGADGRFEFTALGSELKKQADDPSAELDIWIYKPDLAVGHSSFCGQPPEQPISLFLEAELPFEVLVKRPNGSPCPEASAAPLVARFGFDRVIPKSIRDRLKTRTAVDGRLIVHGFKGQLAGVKIEKAEFGSLTLVIPKEAVSPFTAMLHEPRDIAGQVSLPKGEKVDFSRIRVTFTDSSERNTESENGIGKPVASSSTVTWLQGALVQPDHDGRFTIVKALDHGTGEFAIEGLDDLLLTSSAPVLSPGRNLPSPSQSPHVDLSLRKGIWCSIVVRESQTKRPLPRINLLVAPERPKDRKTNADQVRGRLVPHWAETDGDGRFRICLCPGDAYYVQCSVPQGYFDSRIWNGVRVQVPLNVGQFQMPPFELVRACTVNGYLLDVNGQPVAGTRICGKWHVQTEPDAKSAADVSHWTMTDSAGHFKFEDVGVGMTVTLVPVRAGVPLADPIVAIAADDKPVQLKVKKEKLVALSGRILGQNHRPIPGAQIVVETCDSPDPSSCYRTVANFDGSFQTPLQFPPKLKYRLAVRSLLDNVGASEWMCPAVSGKRFPDLVVDGAKVSRASRLSGKEVVARINGQPIYGSEVLEYGASDILPPDGVNLLEAGRKLKEGRITESKYRALQETAIRLNLVDIVRYRILAQALQTQLNSDEKKECEEFVSKQLDAVLAGFEQENHEKTLQGLDQVLQRQGASLASLRREGRYLALAKSYDASATPENSDINWHQNLAYYNAHRAAYATKEKICWKLLEINCDKEQSADHIFADDIKPRKRESAIHSDWTGLQEKNRKNSVISGTSLDTTQGAASPGDPFAGLPQSGNPDDRTKNDQAQKTKSHYQTGETVNSESDNVAQIGAELGRHINLDKARRVMGDALKELEKGESFDTVAKKFSDGPYSDRGGWQLPTNPESVADEKTADALRRLREGETSTVIETDHSVRIVRVMARIPAGFKPFEEVNDAITHILQSEIRRKRRNEAFSSAVIESPLIDDLPSFLRALADESSITKE